MTAPDLAARVSALEAEHAAMREREAATNTALRLLRRSLDEPHAFRRNDRADLTVAIAHADPEFRREPPPPTPSADVIARVRECLHEILERCDPDGETGADRGVRHAVAGAREALRLLDGAPI